MRFAVAASAFAAISLFCVTSGAQTVSGTITGTIVDPSQAGVAGATVILTNPATGEVRSAKSGGTGDFVFTALQPGVYRVAVEKEGFKRLERQHIALTAAERLTVGNLRLDIGTLTQSVVVSAEGARVQTVSQERSALLDSAQMAGLMTRGRDPLSLLKTLPGIVPGGDSSRLGDGGAPTSIQGGRRTQTTMSVDGVTGNDLSSTESFKTPVNMDAVAEVKVQLSNYQAEYGRSGSAVINLIVKSGTTQFHGGGYYYLRNEALNANDFFNNRNRVPRPVYRYKDGGWNIGGPVYIPGRFNREKNKLLFFVSQEFVRSFTPSSLVQNTVPTALELGGDFSQTLTTAGVQQRITDPLNGQQFPGNVIPQSRIDANAKKMLGIFPKPNFFDRTISKGNYNLVFQYTSPSPRTQTVFRTDYNATEKLRFYFRGNVWRNKTSGYGAAAAISMAGISESYYGSDSNSGVVNATYTISPTLVNEISFGASRWLESGGPLDSSQLTPVQRRAVGVTIGQFNPAGNPLDLLPTMSFGGVPGAGSFSFDQRYPIGGASTIFDFTEGLTKIAGSHTVKVGLFIERARMYKGYRGTFAGALNFGTDSANPGNTGYAYANAMIGNFLSYSESTSRPFVDMRGFQGEWYLQDNWRATRKLTLEYGMRFYTYVPLWQANQQASSFLPDLYSPSKAVVLYRPAINPANGARQAQNPITGAFAPAVYIGALAPGAGDPANGMVLQDKSPKGFMDNNGVLFAPRVGFAYDPFGNGKTAIRGGIGVFYNPIMRGGGVGGTSQSFVNNPPILYTEQLYYGNLSSLLPANIASMQSAGVNFPSAAALGVDKKGEIATTYNYSFGIQRDIGFGTVVDVAYVGALGRHLQMRQDLNTVPYGANFLPANQDPTVKACSAPGCAHLPTNFYVPYAGYSSVRYFVHNSNSSYHSLQVQANRRMAKGLQYGVAFTYSKAMDYGDGAEEDSLPIYQPRQSIYGLAGHDRPFILSFNWVWDVPRGSRLWNSVVARALLDDWHLSGIASMISGSPASVSFSTNPSIDISGGGDFTRVDVVGNPVLPKSQRTLNRFFDPTAFAQPAVGTAGNAGKRTFRGPGANNWDLSLYKTFKVKERASFQLRWEAYNAFNHTQYNAVNTSAIFNAAKVQTNQLFGSITGTADPRIMQGSLRFTF